MYRGLERCQVLFFGSVITQGHAGSRIVPIRDVATWCRAYVDRGRQGCLGAARLIEDRDKQDGPKILLVT